MFHPLRLKNHRAVVMKAKPFHVRYNRVDMFRPAPRAVNILDPQLERATKGAREIMRAHRGKGVSDMQPPIRAWRKTGCCHRLWRNFYAADFNHRNTTYSGFCPLDVGLTTNRLAIVKLL